MKTQKLSHKKGLISVIMPCFNSEAYLKDSIDCILGQTHKSIELIVVDDGSTDGSPDILKHYGSKIKTVFQENQGPGPARNRGIEEARGEFLAFMNPDDHMKPHTLERLHGALTGSDMALSYCGWQDIGEPEKKCRPYIPPDYEQGDKVENFLRWAAPWPIHAVLLRHHILLEEGPFDDRFPICGDYDLWLRIGTARPIKRVNEVLSYHRKHDASQITSGIWKKAFSALKVKQNYISRNSEKVNHIAPEKLTELTYGTFLKLGFDAYGKKDITSAHKIFRSCLKNRYHRPGDLKYMLPSIMPEAFFKNCMSFFNSRAVQKISPANIKDFVIKDKCIPWSLKNRYEIFLEQKLFFSSPVMHRVLKYRRIKPISQAITQGDNHFFGYYEKTPWNQREDKILAHKAPFNNRPPNPGDKVAIGYVRPDVSREFIAVSSSGAWNFQQGAMLQWHPGAPDSTILFNDMRENRHVGISYNIETGSEKVFQRPIYAVSPSGDVGFSLNFTRLHHHRPGYGYPGVDDPFSGDPHPRKDGIFRVNLKSGNSKLIISLNDLATLTPLSSMQGKEHWVNHLQISPRGKRMAFFHIWRMGTKDWAVRLYTSTLAGSELSCLLDTGEISHYDWQDDNTILVWAKHPEKGKHFLLCSVDTGKVKIFCKDILTEDGHCSFSPDGKWIINDTYPDRHNLRRLMLVRSIDGKRIDLMDFYSPREKWWGEIRCDLHPRWNRSGDKICVDSVHTGSRQMHVIDLKGII